MKSMSATEAMDVDAEPIARGDDLEGLSEPFDEFYVRERSRFVSLAFALCGSTGLAEDVAQDAFLAAFGQWDRIDNPSAWMRRVIANKSASVFRRRAYEAKHLLLGHEPDQTAAPELPSDVWAEVRSLPRRQAQAISLRYVDRAPVTEIAEALGVSENTVKTHLRRGKQALAREGRDPR